jgi:hypothetical protein
VKIRLSANPLLLTVLLIVFTSPSWAGSHSHRAKQENPTDPGYVLALAAADRFLHAWQIGDIENGMVQLSDRVRRSGNADKVEQFFSDAKDRAFEITRGNGQPGRYHFPVVLIWTQGSRITRKVSELILIETGKNDWVVDKLP